MIRALAACLISGFVLAACSGGMPPATTAPEGQTPHAASDATLLSGAALPAALETAAAAALATPIFSPADDRPPASASREFTTEFSRHSVPYTEIILAGPPKDGIPAIDAPKFVTAEEAGEWLTPVEPVIFLELNGDVRAYPLQILIWHELVNDTVGGVPVVVTFCPLCNTAIAFERSVGEQVLDFGTTGRLRYSNLIMYDRQTESWWQQATGEAIAGELTGTRLTFQPASIIAWQDFEAAHLHGLVLSRGTGFSRPYGQNPYAGYDDVNHSPFVYEGWLSTYRGPLTPEALPPIARVLTVDLNGEAVAYPYDLLRQEHVVNDTIGGQAIVVFWAEGTASALDADLIAEGRDVGAAAAYARELEGRLLTFALADGIVLDQETRSEWNVLGQAVAGPLAGQKLAPVVAINHFWFSWAAFKPETRIYQR